MSLNISPENVDVNVHPTKEKVSFLHQDAIIERIKRGMDEKLINSNAGRTFYTQKQVPGGEVETTHVQLNKTTEEQNGGKVQLSRVSNLSGDNLSGGLAESGIALEDDVCQMEQEEVPTILSKTGTILPQVQPSGAATKESHENANMFPHFREAELYNKCLFRAISLKDLLNELERKKVEFTDTDSYLILTLKMRAKLLEESNADQSLIQPLQDEIKSYQSNVREKKVYTCCLTGCPYKTNNHEKYVSHLRACHPNSRQKMVCKVKGCQRDFHGLNLLEIHVKTAHRSRPSLVKLSQSQLVEQLNRLKCLSFSCSHQIVPNIKELKKHLKTHFDRRETIGCIFSGCNFETDNAGTLRSHFSRIHKIQDLQHLKPEIVLDDASSNLELDGSMDDISGIDISIDDRSRTEEVEDFHENDFEPDTEFQDVIEENDEDQLDVFMKAIAITFNDWMNMKNIPYSTCNLIIKEIFHCYSEGLTSTEKKIRKLLQAEGWEEYRIVEIIQKIENDDPFSKARIELESERKRINYIKETFDYCQPETVLLDKESGDSYQYIPITKSLKILVEDETFIKQKLADVYFQENDVYKDVRDGEYFKANNFFRKNPEAVPILMFQDELEVANPLGSGKTKHKINCTYYTTYQVQTSLRCKIQSVHCPTCFSCKKQALEEAWQLKNKPKALGRFEAP